MKGHLLNSMTKWQ